MGRLFWNSKSIILFSSLAILFFQIAVGIYAIYLSRLFYAKYGPFYDSMAYFNSLADMHARAQSDGHLAALIQRTYHSTVFYPWLAFAPFAGAVNLDRIIAIWIQVFASAVMQFALFAYFLREHRDCKVALASSTVFMGIAALFWFNGGIADFRMDLIQYFFYTAVMALYLIARSAKTHVKLCWMFFGVGVGILCLARATSPVYLILLAVVLAPVDLWSSVGRRRELLAGWAIAVVAALAVAGWFYLINWKFLHYYYFVWNLDANAKLPITQSASHIAFALSHVGSWLSVALLLRAAVIVLAGLQQCGPQIFRRANWRPAWFSVAPVGYLVLSGAGLNPFVSIVGVAGLVMFLLEPLVPAPRPIRPPLEWLLATIIFAAMSANIVRALDNYSREDRVSSWIPRREGLDDLVRAMTDNVIPDRPREYRYGVAHIGTLSADVIFNTLAYDQKLPVKPNATVVYRNATLGKCYQGVGTQVEWNAIQGGTDDEKIDRVVHLVDGRCDFFAMADTTSQLPPFSYINRFIPEIYRRMLLSGHWQTITGSLQISSTERIILLRNRGRNTDADAN
jgi:hypothetical protein